MAYEPSILALDDWNSPVTITGNDPIKNLDNAVNSIIASDPNSLQNHINQELAKLPTYLNDELVVIADLATGGTAVNALALNGKTVVDSVTSTDKEAPVSADAMRLTYLGIVPLGGIVMYDGLLADIPSNWALCDGTNGTPNLVSKFIYGTATEMEIGDTGGSADAVVVAHTHTANHSHSASSNTTGAHTHGSPLASGTAGSTGGWGGPASGGYATTTSNGNHSHTITVNTANVTTSSSGESGTDKNIPPYVKLAYIKRIS